MRLRSLALIAILLLANVSACRYPEQKTKRAPASAPAPVAKPLSPAEQAGCKRTDPATLRFNGRYALRSGVSVCIYSKPDPMLSMSPPLGPRYAELFPVAQRGNPEAQLKLAVILNSCSNTPSTPEGLKTTLATALKTRRYLGGTRVEDPKAFENRLRQEYRDCEGVDPAQRGRAQDWAQGAAAAGLMDAQESLTFMSRQGNVFYSWKRDTKDNNAHDAAYYKNTMTALIAARDAGSAVALLALAGRYAQYQADNPPWERDDFDPLKSYAHFAAYDQIQQAIGGKRREPLKGTLVGDVHARLTARQRVAAEALAKTFLSNPRCCVVIE